MGQSDEFDLAKSPGQLLHRAQQFAADHFAKAMPKGERLTQRQFAVLAATAANEGLNQSKLVKATGIDRSTLAELVARMAEKDVLTRTKVRGDARANAIHLTEKGRAAFETALTGAIDADTAILDALPKGKRNNFLKSLTRIASTIEQAEAARKAEKKKAKDAAKKALKKARKAKKAAEKLQKNAQKTPET